MATHSSILAWWIPGTGAWWAAVSRVALSRTWLKRRSSNSSLEEKTNLDRILKFRDIALPTKVCLVKAVVCPVVMYGCKSWSIKKAECWKTEAFELWCWRRHLRVPWTARRSYQSILKEISLEYSLEGLMLKLKVQYFGHMMWRTDSLEKTLMLGKIEGVRRRDDWGWDGWMASPTQWTWVWVHSGSWWWTGRPGVLGSMGLQRVGVHWATELTELNWWLWVNVWTLLYITWVYAEVSMGVCLLNALNDLRHFWVNIDALLALLICLTGK